MSSTVLDPKEIYTRAYLDTLPTEVVQRWQIDRDIIMMEENDDNQAPKKHKVRLADADDVVFDPAEDDQAPTYHPYPRPIGPALPKSIVTKRALVGARRLIDREDQKVGRGNVVRLAGDKKDLIVGYKANSLCNTLVQDCLDRAHMAVKLLDQRHAQIVLARLAKAGVKNSNASHADMKEISYKKAVSIALQAERWVYEAQAAAAKSMVKESKRCLHALAGKRRRTTEEKATVYRTRTGEERGTRTDRAVRKYQKKIAALQEK